MKSFSSQYASKILYHNKEQRLLAVESKESMEIESGSNIFTDIVPEAGFYQAEDYHQKYYLRGLPDIQEELKRIYPNIGDYVASTAVARLNGYAGGYGTISAIQEQLENLGLSADSNDKLLKTIGNNLIPGCPVSPTIVN